LTFSFVGNVLLDSQADGFFTCVICDFGFANVIGDERKVRGMTTPENVGITIRYSAPEVLSLYRGNLKPKRFCTEEDKKIDVYAFAITLYEITFRKSAWPRMDNHDLFELVCRGERPIIDTAMIYKLCKIGSVLKSIRSGWDQTASLRPSFEEIYQNLLADFNKFSNDTQSITADLCVFELMGEQG
jgi:serine/threonine protein kinase